MECYELAGDCSRCRILELTGQAWQNKRKPCQMPFAVAKLLAKKGVPDDNLTRY